MRPIEIKQMGLDKLSPEERVRLEAWLTRFAGVAAQVAQGDSAPVAPPISRTAIETQIDGEFEGWSGETVFKMVNGQIWEQTSYAYTYHYAYRPKAIIFQDGGVFRMKVDGVSDSIQVRRLK